MIPLNLEPFIFDCEVFAYDWLFVFKNKVTGEYTEIWNDNEAVEQFMTQEPLLAGFNNKHYDQFILKAVLSGFTPEEIKAVNDFIIVGGHEGWEYAPLRDFLRPIRSDGRLPDGFVPESNRSAPRNGHS